MWLGAAAGRGGFMSPPEWELPGAGEREAPAGSQAGRWVRAGTRAAWPSRDQSTSVASPARRLWPRFPSALEKEWKEVRQPAGQPVPFGRSRACAHVPPPAAGAARPPALHPPRFPERLLALLLTLCRTPYGLGQTFSPDLTGFPEFPATFHLHSAAIQCSPSPPPITLHYTKARSSLARGASPMSPATSCHFWRGKRCVMTTGSSKDCLSAGLLHRDPWEQGWGVAAAAVPRRCHRSGCNGEARPTDSPQTWHCTSRTNTGPKDVISGVLTKTQQLIVLLTHPHGHKRARRAGRAAPAAAREELQPEQQSLSLCPVSAPRGVHWVRAPIDLSLSQFNAGLRPRLRTQSGKCGVLGWGGTGGTDGDFPYKEISASMHLPDPVHGIEPSSHFTDLGVGTEGTQSRLFYLCFHPAFP